MNPNSSNQVSTSTLSSTPIDIIEKEIKFDKNYSNNIDKILQELSEEGKLEDNNTTYSTKSNTNSILILKRPIPREKEKKEKLIINLKDFYVQGFINKNNNYFYKLEKDFNNELFKAVKSNNLERVKELLEKGANINAKDIINSRTPLHEAAQNNVNRKMVQLLIDEGANINARNIWDNTPLHWAATWHYSETVQVLIENGADVNIQNENGDTPLDLILNNKLLQDNKQISSILENIFYKDFETEIKKDFEKVMVIKLDMEKNGIGSQGFEDFQEKILIHMKDYQNEKTKLTLNLNRIELQPDKAKIQGAIQGAKEKKDEKINERLRKKREQLEKLLTIWDKQKENEQLKENEIIKKKHIKIQGAIQGAKEKKDEKINERLRKKLEKLSLEEQLLDSYTAEKILKQQTSTTQSKTKVEITEEIVAKLGARPKGSKIVPSQIEDGCKPYEERQSKKDDDFDKDGASSFSQCSNPSISSINVGASTSKTSQQYQNQETKQSQGKRNQLNLEQQYQEILKKIEQLEIEKQSELQKLTQLQSSESWARLKNEFNEEITKPQEKQSISIWDDNFESFLPEVPTHEFEEIPKQKSKITKPQVSIIC